MAQPNIVNVTSILGTSVVTVLTTTLTTTIVTAAADKVNKMNLIRCTNITDNDATVDFDVDKTSSFYLMETDLLRGGASAGSAIDVLVSFEILDDA